MLVIITEGKDEVFIKEYLEFLGYENEVHFKTDSIGGWTKIKLSEPILKRYRDEGNTVVLVFDADTSLNDGGYQRRLDEINDVLEDIDLTIDVFLLPNGADDGDYETLLERIAVADRSRVFSCFDSYETCVRALETDDLKFITPIRKSRIYAYIETFPESNRARDKELKSGTNFFKNPSYWNLNSDSLQPLHDFLIPKL
ncbi:DUF3226 domain-containing protein [Bizionia sp. KMM 8389]